MFESETKNGFLKLIRIIYYKFNNKPIIFQVKCNKINDKYLIVSILY